MTENNHIPNSSGNSLSGQIPKPENPAAADKTGFQPKRFAKIVQIIAFVGIPLVLILGILEHFQRSSFEESLSRERQDMQEILTQTASRGNIQKNYNSLFERLSQIPWTQQNFMTKFAEIY